MNWKAPQHGCILGNDCNSDAGCCAIQQKEGVYANRVLLLALAVGAISVEGMLDTLDYNEMHCVLTHQLWELNEMVQINCLAMFGS